MATCHWTVQTALKKLGVVGSGRDARPADFNDTFDALKGMYGAWIASGAMGRLRDVAPTGSRYVAYGGERVYRTSPDTLEVALPELVQAGCFNDYGHDWWGTIVTLGSDSDQTLVTTTTNQPVGYAVPPRDGAVVMISDAVGGQTQFWLYDGTAKKWQGVHLIDANDEAPRSTADPQGLAAMLAIEVCDQFGVEPTGGTLAQANRFKVAMTSAFGMRREQVSGVYY